MNKSAKFKTTVTSWSFPQLTLKEIVGLAKVLNLGGVDIGYFYRAALDRDSIIARPEEYAKEIELLDHSFPCLYHLFGDSLEDKNVADLDSLDNNIKSLSQATKFCRQLGVEQIMLLPGMIASGETRHQAFEKSVKSLNQLVPIATEAGLNISVEPHVHGLLESPQLAKELVEQVPNLGLTLDHAHLVCLGYTQDQIDELIPYATHIHLRQARAGVLQEKMAFGTINFNAILALLVERDYRGYVAYEYVHQEYMNTLSDDVISETILMRDLVQNFLSVHN